MDTALLEKVEKGGVLPAHVTPQNKDGDVDLTALRNVVDFDALAAVGGSEE